MHLTHLHLPGLTRYPHASMIQEHLVRQLLDHKARARVARSPPPPPPPTILTAEFHPVYTLGRRDHQLPPPHLLAHPDPDPQPPPPHPLAHPDPQLPPPPHPLTHPHPAADVHTSQRGGQTTFHGPGQLVAYAILDLQRHGLSARSHVRLLEQAVVAVLAGAPYGLRTGTLARWPGVWTAGVAGEGEGETRRKIASVGVHLRRHVASHGVAVNLETDLRWFEGVVALVAEMASRLAGVDEVRRVEVEDVLSGMDEAARSRYRLSMDG
ncbi:MAG: hypothetical protein M1826_000522 [Phylliscum demangeonii]|nr:MAG: hypothetical protein M1826_000522 [Phylliscum demangeonii]